MPGPMKRQPARTSDDPPRNDSGRGARRCARTQNWRVPPVGRGLTCCISAAARPAARCAPPARRAGPWPRPRQAGSPARAARRGGRALPRTCKRSGTERSKSAAWAPTEASAHGPRPTAGARSSGKATPLNQAGAPVAHRVELRVRRRGVGRAGGHGPADDVRRLGRQRHGARKAGQAEPPRHERQPDAQLARDPQPQALCRRRARRSASSGHGKAPPTPLAPRVRAPGRRTRSGWCTVKSWFSPNV